MTKLGLTVDEVLSTTRTVRKRLDFDRPVERSVLLECLEAALQSPTGGNRQNWQWLLVTDPDKRGALADIYRKGWVIYSRGADRAPGMERLVESSQYLADNFHRVPAMLIPCMPRVPQRAPHFWHASQYGSILPGVWSFMLAARERGLGTAWTTIHLMNEEEAAAVLEIPYDKVMQCALVTIGYSIGTDFKPGKRIDLEDILHWDAWNQR